ncbi:hypothetical protein LIER_34128 [Lithospermum erythrorhizon]|uniref:Uncharacterized protein n=1 Tax=Lithospermum erythrorhizon TaxID=34254 RepID=A0AAV3S1Q0_LITER
MAGSGILRDTHSSSPNRENSPVHTIDVNTLSQEETQDDIFQEIDNFPSDTLAPTPGDISSVNNICTDIFNCLLLRVRSSMLASSNNNFVSYKIHHHEINHVSTS